MPRKKAVQPETGSNPAESGKQADPGPKKPGKSAGKKDSPDKTPDKSGNKPKKPTRTKKNKAMDNVDPENEYISDLSEEDKKPDKSNKDHPTIEEESSSSTSYETDTSDSSDTDEGSFDNVELDEDLSIMIPRSYMSDKKKYERFETYLKSLDKKLDKFSAKMQLGLQEVGGKISSNTNPESKSIKDLTAKRVRGPDKKPRAPRTKPQPKEPKQSEVLPSGLSLPPNPPVVPQKKSIVTKSVLKI